MTSLFEIDIAFNEKTQEYGALVRASGENKFAALRNKCIRTLLWELREAIVAKVASTEPEPSKIISLEESRPPLVAANGEVLNGLS